MGLQGMINDLVQQSDFPTGINNELDQLELKKSNALARIISAAEIFRMLRQTLEAIQKKNKTAQFQYWELRELVAQENHLLDELVRRFC
jgi:methylmalonyl-CoA mutase